MYFSRVTVIPGNLNFDARKKLFNGDAYAGHQLLWESFPGDPDAARDFLFRQEFEQEQMPDYRTKKKGLPLFYMISKRRPESSRFLRLETKDYDPQFDLGQQFVFDLRANPIISIKETAKGRGKKHDVMMDAKRKAKEKGLKGDEMKFEMEKAAKEWLIRKGIDNGFGVEKNSIEIKRYFQNRFFKGTSKTVQFSSVDYHGIVRVEDTDKLRRTLFSGLGRSKGFGCGMMMIKRTGAS